MSLAAQMVAQFARMVRGDGGELVVLEETDDLLRIGYVSGEDPECANGACVLPPSELQEMMREWLERRAPGVRVVVQPAAAGEAAQ